MAQLPDPIDPSKVVQTALGGIKEAIKAGRDIKETAHEVNAFLDEEARAKVAWRRKQQEVQRRGDMMYVDAISEYRLLAQIQKAKAEAFKQVEKEFGKQALQEIKDLEARLRKERKDLQSEFDADRRKEREQWLIILVLGAVIYGFLKFTGLW